MNAEAQRIVDLTSELVAIPTHEREQEAQELLASRLAAIGFDHTLQEVEPGRPNLVAWRGSGGPFLCSHVDVHPPHDHPDPWTCRMDDGALVGRGVLDAKGQIAALVAALEAVPSAPATVVVCCDEESGGKGSELLELPEALRPTAGGVVLEPTGMRICHVEAGCVDVRIEVEATPAHAYSGDGVSAVHVLDGAIEALRGCGFLAARHPELPPPSLLVGTVSAGEHAWRVPRRATMACALGLIPGVDPLDARREVEDVLAGLALGWSRRGAELRGEVVDVSEPLSIPEDLPVSAALQRAAGGELELGGMPSWTDAANLWLHHGVPCVVLGAGQLGPAHSDREWVRLDDLVRLSDVLRGLLEGWPHVSGA